MEPAATFSCFSLAKEASLPTGLESLTLGDSFSYPLDKVVLPEARHMFGSALSRSVKPKKKMTHSPSLN